VKVYWLLFCECGVFVVKTSLLFVEMIVVTVLQRKEYFEEKQIMQVV